MDEKKSLERLQRLCSRAEYCSGDIYRKALNDLEGDAEGAARIVASLVKDRFVDDARYSAAFAREKSALQGWGAFKIRMALRGKGIADEVIDTALSETDPEKSALRLERLLREKARLLQGDPQIRLKLLKYALSRGYSYEEVNPVAEAILHS